MAAVEFIVVTRPGASFEIPAGARVRELGGLDLPVSSSDIRKQVADGAEEVAVPAAVLTYIRERGLYGSTRLPFTA